MKRTFICSYSRVAWLILLGMALLFADFFSKAYVYHVLPLYDNCMGTRCLDIPVFYDFLGIDFLISLTINKGAAWGFFADFQFILIGIRILVIFGIFIYLFFINLNPHIYIPLILIIAGALGNVIDF